VERVDPPWSNFPAVRRTRKDADPVGDSVVFDIENNEARLISYISYEMGTVTVLAVLTHKEYDKGGWKNACNCRTTASQISCQSGGSEDHCVP